MNFCKKRSIVCLYQKCVEFVCIIGHRKMPRGMRYECIFPTDRFGAAHAPEQAVCPLASGAAAGVPCCGASGRLSGGAMACRQFSMALHWPPAVRAAVRGCSVLGAAVRGMLRCRFLPRRRLWLYGAGDSGLLRQCRLAAMAAYAVAAAALFSVSLFPAVRQKRGRRISGERCCRYRHRVCGSSIGHAIFGISDRIK